MGTEILAHVVFPLIGVYTFLLMVLIVDRREISTEICNDVAIDLCILGIGTTGGIFVNPTITHTYAEKAGLYAASVTAVDLFVGVVLLYFRYRRANEFAKAASAFPPIVPPPVSMGRAVQDLVLGNFTLAVAIVVIAYGLHNGQPACDCSQQQQQTKQWKMENFKSPTASKEGEGRP